MISSSTTLKTIDITPSWGSLASVFELVARDGTIEGFAMVVEELAKVTNRAAAIASAFRAADESQMAGDLDKARTDLREVLVAADQKNAAARAARN